MLRRDEHKLIWGSKQQPNIKRLRLFLRSVQHPNCALKFGKIITFISNIYSEKMLGPKLERKGIKGNAQKAARNWNNVIGKGITEPKAHKKFIKL